MKAFLGIFGALGLAGAAGAARVDVQVQDATGRPLPGAVALLDSPAARAAVRPRAGLEIAQADKAFAPRVSIVPVGSEVQFPNRDTVRHHVFSFSKAKTFEIKLYAGTPANPVRFDRPGIAVLGCNIHDTMVAWVVVVETPWAALGDALGQVRLGEVPAGSYTLRVWHPDLPPGSPPLEQPLTVGSADVAPAVRLGQVR
jgi:plastocyanin